MDVHAQAPPGPLPVQANPFGMTLYDLVSAPTFSATLICVDDREATVSIRVASAKGMTWADFDVTTLPNLELARRDELKSNGMDRIVVVTRPDRERLYVIYPGVKAVVEMALAPRDRPMAYPGTTVETVEGRALRKSVVQVLIPDAGRQDMSIWTDPSRPGVPVRTVLAVGVPGQSGSRTVVARFEDVKLGGVDLARFDPPQKFKRFHGYAAFVNWVADRIHVQ